MVRSKPRIKKMEKIKRTPTRQILIEHVLKHFPYWEITIDYMTNEFLLINCQMKFRKKITKILQKEIELKNQEL